MREITSTLNGLDPESARLFIPGGGDYPAHGCILARLMPCCSIGVFQGGGVGRESQTTPHTGNKKTKEVDKTRETKKTEQTQ